MAQKVHLGYNSFVGFTVVSTTAEVATGPNEFMFVDSFSFKREHEEQIQTQEIGIGDRSPRRRVVGNVSANGSFTKNMDPDNGVALYQYVLGGTLSVTAAGSAAFDHIFLEGDDVPSATRLQFETNAGGGSQTAYRWINGIVSGYTLNASVNSPVKETFNLMFSDHSPSPINTVSTVALTPTPPINFNKVCVSLGTSITTLSIIATKDITLNINNEMVENRELCTNTVAAFNYSTRSIDGTMNITFESDMNTYQDFVNNTYLAMRILCESTDATSATNHSVIIDLPQVYMNGETPDVSDPNEIVQPLNFSAIYGSNAGYMVKITVHNSQPTLSA